MIMQANTMQMQISYHMNTANKSFIDMHYFLKHKGIKNNKFFLALYDADLANIDPRDPRLNTYWKQKVLRECYVNYWYFLREVIRIPDTGGAVGGGVHYRLDRGNLALNFGFMMNWNMFLELPRQFGKTMSSLCWYLWVFNFGTTNSEMMFMNKKHDDSKMNLRRIKELRAALPSYLQMDSAIGADGVKKKATSNVETLTHVSNNNRITTKPGARTKAQADGLGRGCTMPLQWYDEYAFIANNKTIYNAATPAFTTASANAKRNGKPYGILITTTPGDLTTEEGQNANNTRNNATPFNETFYDKSIQQLEEIKNANKNSEFFYIRFTYQQLGKGEEYFQKMVKQLEKDWPVIRREVLLEWSAMSNNSPFTQYDLELVSTFIKKEPMTQLELGPGFYLNVYSQAEMRKYPPILGVDVSGGFSQDASAITIIDSETTSVLADFNCNYISPIDLGKVIYQIVVKYMPNAIVNIERNGGFGASVIAFLKNTRVKRNLYYEIKDRVLEERFNGMKMVRKQARVKVYGLDQTKDTRNLLMEMLRDRVENHKQKILSPIIYNELCTLEIKRGGKIEHADNAHDDGIFSWLIALYVWYEGKNLMENFGLKIREIDTDNELDEGFDVDMDDSESSMIKNMENQGMDEDAENQLSEQLDYLDSARSYSYEEWLAGEKSKNTAAMQALLKNQDARQAYAEKYHINIQDLNDENTGFVELPQDLFNMEDGEQQKSQLQEQFENMHV